MIRRLAAEGKTILVSSHILTELAEMCDAVAIIEQGKLLAVGSVEEIQKGQLRQRRSVKARVLGGAEGLAHWLTGRDDSHEPKVDGEYVLFSHDGDVDSEAELLREIVQQGFRVAQFGSREQSLEDVFMQVTEGLVQ
jgi:ABC-2 type transport system ATP-binding protein